MLMRSKKILVNLEQCSHLKIRAYEKKLNDKGEIIKEVHKLREEIDFWQREAIESKAQLGEIRILAESNERRI